MELAVIGIIAAALALWQFVSPLVIWNMGARLKRLEARLDGMERLAKTPTPSPQVQPDQATNDGTAAAIPASANESPKRSSEELWPVQSSTNKAAASAPPNEAQPRKQLRGDTVAPATTETSSWETQIASRWMVWTGAVALVLGVVFLIKYSIEQQLFGPEMRIMSGVALGTAFLGAGEWLRRRPLLRPIASFRPEYIPSAVSGAGLVSLFATTYAAHAVFGMIGVIPAFLLLAIISCATIALSLLHGASFALFGTLAGFTIPALFSSLDPSPLNLFPYLTVLSAACLLLVRYKRWWWLGWTTVSLALAWTLIWAGSASTALDVLIGGGFLLVLSACVIATRQDLMARAQPFNSFMPWVANLVRGEPFVLGTLAGVSIVMMVVVLAAAFTFTSLALALGFVALLVAFARLHESLIAAAFLALLFAITLLSSWWLALGPDHAWATALFDEKSRGWLLPRRLETLGLVAALFAALFGLGGYFAQKGSRMPAVWAALAAMAPLVHTVLLYVMAQEFRASIAWSILALGLAGLNLMATERLMHRSMRPSAGAFAAAACAALALAGAFIFREIWLTLALAMMLPALAWVHGRVRLQPLRWIAWVLVAIVLVRLVANPYVPLYDAGDMPTWIWVLVGYGLPALAFFSAGKLFSGKEEDRLVLALHAGAIAFAFGLQVLETRLVFAGGFLEPLNLAEAAVHTLLWLAASIALMRASHDHPNPVLRWSGWFFFTIAMLMSAGGSLIALNPLFVHQDVGSMPLINLLAVSYAAPAALLMVLARDAARREQKDLAAACWSVSLLLAFVYASLQVRHFFHGPYLDLAGTGPAEAYLGIAVWLVLLIGFRQVTRQLDHPWLNIARRVVLFLTIAGIVLGQGLLFNPLIKAIDVGALPLFNLLTLAFALPALLLVVVSRQARRDNDAIAARTALIAAMSLGVLYFMLEIRHAFQGGDLSNTLPGGTEIYAYTLCWLLLGLVTHAAGERFANPLVRTASRLMLMAAIVNVVCGHGILANPLLGPISVGDWPIINSLTMGLAMPAILFAWHARQQQNAIDKRLANLCWGVAIALVFADATLEIRRIFHGAYLNQGWITDGELYSYSAAWLLFGLVLLAAALFTGRRALRYVSLALVSVVAVKVFLWDMAGLTGIFRALSFLGLGGVLVGIGIIYQRFVFVQGRDMDAAGP